MTRPEHIEWFIMQFWSWPVLSAVLVTAIQYGAYQAQVQREVLTDAQLTYKTMVIGSKLVLSGLGMVFTAIKKVVDLARSSGGAADSTSDLLGFGFVLFVLACAFFSATSHEVTWNAELPDEPLKNREVRNNGFLKPLAIGVGASAWASYTVYRWLV